MAEPFLQQDWFLRKSVLKLDKRKYFGCCHIFYHFLAVVLNDSTSVSDCVFSVDQDRLISVLARELSPTALSM